MTIDERSSLFDELYSQTETGRLGMNEDSISSVEGLLGPNEAPADEAGEYLAHEEEER